MGPDFPLKVDSNAWCAEPGPILLLAGPGTGKTHQLALRIKFLVEKKKIPADAIAVVTFTREAAHNMRRRISDQERPDVFIPYDFRPQRIMTMHGLGLDIVRTNSRLLGLQDNFDVMTDPKLQACLFRDAAHSLGYGEKEAQEAARVRRTSEPVDPNSESVTIGNEYEKILRACHVIDYDDQIRLACKLLLEQPAVKAQYATITHLLIDEYQDINADQRQLINLLSERSQTGLFVVGDDDQSIYQFRGGNPKYIREFDREFGDQANVLCLAESRRCPETIIRGGLNVLEAFDKARIAKPEPVFSERKKGGAKVQIHSVPSDDDEAKIIARLTAKALPKNRVLILVPAKQYAAKIKRALSGRAIAYSHTPNLEEMGLLGLREVYGWAQNPEDNLALRRCIEALCEAGALDIPSPRVRKEELKKKRAVCLEQIADLWDEVLDNGTSLWSSLKAAASNPDKAFLASIYEKLKNIQDATGVGVGDYLKAVANNMKLWASCEDLVEEVNSWIAELKGGSQQGEGEVRIMTLQSAKGLEAEMVFVVGLNDGIFPCEASSQAQIAEAARLFYVSMTRAISELHLFHARKRDGATTFLQSSFALKPSPFIGAIEKAHKEEQYYAARGR